MTKARNTKEKVRIFISHSTSDRELAEMLAGYFSSIGILKDEIFCSSLPGNDINERISGEVKSALENSVVNIAVLSRDYYNSAYCMNEAGIFWFLDKKVIPIALPEIDETNMKGFLNNDFKLRRLDDESDIAYILASVVEAADTPGINAEYAAKENKKLRERYAEFLKTREI